MLLIKVDFFQDHSRCLLSDILPLTQTMSCGQTIKRLGQPLRPWEGHYNDQHFFGLEVSAYRQNYRLKDADIVDTFQLKIAKKSIQQFFSHNKYFSQLPSNSRNQPNVLLCKPIIMENLL